MKLSINAIKDLRVALRSSYGESVESSLADDEVNEIGDLILTVRAESLKIKIAHPELFTPKDVTNSGSVMTLLNTEEIW